MEGTVFEVDKDVEAMVVLEEGEGVVPEPTGVVVVEGASAVLELIGEEVEV